MARIIMTEKAGGTNMPYVVRHEEGGGGTVYKKGSGKKVGKTKGSVKKYLAALYANAKDKK